jgi:SAM-dependent MidA family methyltransferase
MTAAPLCDLDAARSAAVAARIRERAREQGGWLPFSQFMQVALYEPDLGYYMVDRTIFGPAGDYVTAPEMSPLFTRCFAQAVAGALAQTGGGDVVEFGAGSGAMAAELVATLAQLGMPPRRYRIVEPSPVLASRQRRTLSRKPEIARLAGGVEWLERPPAESWRGVAIANEVLDALPVDRFRIAGAGCMAVGVVAAAQGFAWQARAPDAALAAAVDAINARLPAPMPEGFVSEWRPGQRGFLAAAAEALSRGAFFVCDYGLPRAQYYHVSRDGGTLCGFRRHHRVDDALADPGAQDLTAWVDFSALAEDARPCGFEVAGFATQAHFLLATGIDRELARIVEHARERDRAHHRQQAATLLLPGEMGERFKFLALTRGLDAPIPGFGFRDLAASL